MTLSDVTGCYFERASMFRGLSGFTIYCTRIYMHMLEHFGTATYFTCFYYTLRAWFIGRHAGAFTFTALHEYSFAAEIVSASLTAF